MIKIRLSLALSFVLILFLVNFLVQGQRRQRPPWEERSPAVNEKIPEIQIFDQDLDEIPFSNLYKDTLLIIQWGGCT